MALVFIVLGLVLWLATGYTLIGVVLLILGLVFLFGYPFGPGPYYGRRW